MLGQPNFLVIAGSPQAAVAIERVTFIQMLNKRDTVDHHVALLLGMTGFSALVVLLLSCSDTGRVREAANCGQPGAHCPRGLTRR